MLKPNHDQKSWRNERVEFTIGEELRCRHPGLWRKHNVLRLNLLYNWLGRCFRSDQDRFQAYPNQAYRCVSPLRFVKLMKNTVLSTSFCHGTQVDETGTDDGCG